MSSEKRLLRLKEVLGLVGLPRSTMYALMKVGEFPKPVQLSHRSVAWRLSEIETWIDSRRPVGNPKVSPELGGQE